MADEGAVVPPVTLIDPGGIAREVPETAVPAALERGWRVQSAADVQAAAGAEAQRADYGGVTGAIAATAAGAARGVTLGLSDVALRALGGEDAAADLRGLRAQNPGLSAGSEILGAVAPVVLSGGSAAPAAAASRAGGRVASELGGGILARGVGGAVEGAIGAVGATASDLALSADPLTVEGVTSSLSSNLLYGAGVGGAVGLGAATIERGLVRAKNAVDARLSKGRGSSGERVPLDVDGVTSELGAAGRVSADAPTAPRPPLPVDDMTLGELKAARQVEEAAIAEDLKPARQQFVSELEAHLRATDSERYWDFALKHPERYTRELRAPSRRADKTIRRLLDDKIGLADRPHAVLTALREQMQALDKMQKAALREEASLLRAFDEGPEKLRAAIIAGDVPGWVPSALSARGVDNAVETEMLRKFGTTDRTYVVPDRVSRAINDIPKIQQRNQALQDMVDQITAKPSNPRLAEIDAAIGRLSTPKEKSIGEAVLGAIPFAGKIAEVVSVGKRATTGIRSAGARAARRLGESVSRFLGVASAGAETVAPRIPTATAALTRVRYGAQRTRNAEDRREPKGVLEAAFVARTDEIKRQVAIDATGEPRMKPDARARMASNFDGLRLNDPIMADRLEGASARRIEFLARVMPRMPDFGTPRVGPDQRRISDLQMRSFARSVYAAEHPDEVLELAAHGRVVPEHVEALRAVAPEMLAEFIGQVSRGLAETPRRLPWKRRLALSILSGQPLDPLMTPAILGPIQTMYAGEPGTAGGMQAPRAEPQFGSVRAASPTAAQKREQDR
jgi:hypothetical protein